MASQLKNHTGARSEKGREDLVKEGPHRAAGSWMRALWKSMRLVLGHPDQPAHTPSSEPRLRLGYAVPPTFSSSLPSAGMTANAGLDSRTAGAIGAAPSSAMLEELNRLFEVHPQSRTVMRQLAFVEQMMRRGGERMLGELPAHVLLRASRQLDSLSEGRLSPSLAQLSSKLGTALERHSRFQASSAPSGSPGNPQPDTLLEQGSGGSGIFDSDRRARGGLTLPQMPRIARSRDFQPTLPMQMDE